MMERWKAGWEGFAARWDRLPWGWTLAGGLLVGAGLGAVAILGVYGLGITALTAALAVGVALWAEPVWVEEPLAIAPPVEPEPPDPLEMVEIEGGTFWMGSPEDEPGRRDNERLHEVTVSPFLMAKATVTRAEYREIMGVDEAPGAGGDDHPVTEVSWYQAVDFCNRASEKAGFEPCYRIDGREVEWVDGANGYRLPTEAEWEYACRAGTTTRWSFGDDEERLGEYAWFRGNSGIAHPVATRKRNPWKLYDMHGDVWEWCWDVYGEYPVKPVVDPRGPAGDASALRVLRGGSYWSGPEGLRSASRGGDEPGDGDENVGFRCVRRPRPQP